MKRTGKKLQGIIPAIVTPIDEDGKLNFVTHVEENDFFYDEIGSELMIKKLRQEKQDFWESLELYYRIFLLGEDEV